MEAIKHDINGKDHDGSDMPKVAIHQMFMSLIVDISIFWLEESFSWTRLHPFVSSSPVIIHVWAFYFPTPCLGDPPYDCFYPYFWICYISNHWARCLYNDLMMSWLHWLYDYT